MDCKVLHIYKWQKKPDVMIFRLFDIYVKWNTIVFVFKQFWNLKNRSETYAYDTYVIVAKGDSQLFNSKSLLFQVNIANFHNNYITLRKLFSSKFARYKLLKLNIMKIIMVGMVAFLLSVNIKPRKNTKLEVKLISLQ
jgi:hypothetical protein